MKLKLPIAAATLLGGIALVFFGLNEADSFASTVSQAFTGSPTDRSMWMLGTGAALAVFGAVLGLKSAGSGR